MNRNTFLEMSGRVMNQAVRFTLNKANDSPMMQELSFDGMNSDARKIVERVQAFGFTSTPLPRDEQEQKQGQQDGGGGGQVGDKTEQPKGPAAEGIALFLNGQRNHPVVIAIDDRRHRPMGLKPGENAQYDDQGQMTLLRRTGLFLLSLDDDGSGQQPGAVMLRDADGKSTGQSQKQERMVSVRHVEKQKQKRGNSQQGQGSSSGGAGAGTLDTGTGSSSNSQQDYKHEGETVNHEMRVTKGRIEFRSGDTVVGYYDKASTKWVFIGEVHLGKEDASHPAYGVSGGVGMTTATSGAGAVLVNATRPGPPTSMDGQPFEARDAAIAALEARVAALEARAGS